MDWFASDLHFSHRNIIVFQPPRPFATIEEHDEEIVARWNARVSPKDKCLILGDVAFNIGLPHVGRLNGNKILIMGNHEHKNINNYVHYFTDIKSYLEDKENRILFSHIPVHPGQLERWTVNVHGHTHSYNLDDPRYINISLEQTNYAPISKQELLERIKQ